MASSGKAKADIRLSKTLSWILRHGATKVGLTLQPGGFLYVDDLLRLPQLKNVCLEDVMRVVNENAKRRYHLEEDDNGKLRIRANQGHSVQVDGLALSPVRHHSEYAVVVHGTYARVWPSIRTEGLKRMNRTHIHFASDEPGSSEVISGMRHNCEILVFIDLQKAMIDGLQFFTSANGVILSPGNEDGTILPLYFSAVIQRRPSTSCSDTRFASVTTRTGVNLPMD